jgi:regulator of sigma E protease
MEIFRSLFTTSHGLLLGLSGVVGIALLIFIHECGHFIMCKIFGVRTPSFSIGFGPKVYSKKIGDTLFSISALPLGGYVEIAGNAEMGQGNQQESSATDEGSFAVKPFYQKFLIMIGGILFNIIFAYLVFIFVFAAGLPKSEFLYPLNAIPTIAAVTEGSEADKAGLKAGDKILTVASISLNNDVKKFFELIKEKNYSAADLVIERAGQQEHISLPLTHNKEQIKSVSELASGIVFTMADVPGISLWQAIKRGINITNRYIWGTISIFKYIVSHRDTSSVGGPVMMIKATAQGAAKGIKVLLLILAMMSISLAILNLIPLPIFDGGQILFFAIEAIIGRSLPEKARMSIHLISWALVMLLFVLITIKDIWHIISQYLPK